MNGLKQFYEKHPNLVMWAVLALGMVVILIWSARDQGFMPAQWAAIITATVLLAGLCVWIINWD